MASKRTGPANGNGAAVADAPASTGSGNAAKHPARAPRSLEYTAKGVRTGADFANLMSALMGDVIEGTIAPNTANAACNAGRQLLRVVEMQYRYGPASQPSALQLAPAKAGR